MAFPKDGVLLPKPTSVTSSTPYRVHAGFTSSNGEDVTMSSVGRQTSVKDRVAVKAIEGFIKSMRTVGKTEVSVEDIAKSLSLSFGQVERIALKLRGVKAA